MKSKHERWLTETITDQFWERQQDWRQIIITRSAVFAELEAEVAAIVGPVLVELRQDRPMWEIAASVTDTGTDSAERAFEVTDCVRLFLFWMVDTYARHATDPAVVDACAQALRCEHGNRPGSGSCYECEEAAEAFESGQRPLSDLRPSEEAAEVIRLRLAGAYRRAAEAGYSAAELAAITARERIVRPDSTARAMLIGLARVEPVLALASL